MSDVAPSDRVDLRYTANDDTAIVEGWMVKEGKTLKRHTARFLKLKATQLSNHRRPSSKPTWTTSVVDAKVGPGPRRNELVVHLPKRTLSFFTGTAADYQRWMFALKKASERNFNLESFYRLGDVVGEGINGEVLIGWDKVTNEEVAIKSIPYEGDMSAEADEIAEEEIRIVKSIQHERLVRTYDVFRDPAKQRLYIVMEFVRGGELFARVAHEQGNLITEGDAIRIAKDLLAGIAYLHDPVRNIVHRDIKLENILCMDEDISKAVHIKLADFGSSSKLKGRNPALSSLVGTSYYLAPEIINKTGYGRPVDMWACGVVFYIMLSGQFPFAGDDEEEYCQNVVEQAVEFPDDMWAEVSEDAKEFVLGLLEKDAGKRMDVAEAAGHKWLKNEGLPRKAEVKEVDDSELDLDDAPKTIFGRKKKTPAEILEKVQKANGVE